MKLLKHLELSLKKIINKFIFSERRAIKCTSYKNILLETEFIKNTFHIDNINSIKILLLRQDRIGDLLISTPFIKYLYQNMPNSQIDILLGRANMGAKSCIAQYAAKIWCYDKKISNSINLIRQLRKEKYDIIIDTLEAVSTTSAFIIKYVNPKIAIGLDKEKSGIYDYIVPLLDRFNTNITERTANLLMPFGLNINKLDLSLDYNNDEFAKRKSLIKDCSKFRFGVNLAGSSESRFWGIENNIKLIEFIKQKYKEAEIRVFATDKYDEVLSKLKDKFNDIITDKCSSFDEFAFEVSLCDFIISPDTSIVHLASAYKIPSVILYIRKNDMKHQPWYPYKVNFISIETSEDSIRNIKVEDVSNAVEQLYKLENFNNS